MANKWHELALREGLESWNLRRPRYFEQHLRGQSDQTADEEFGLADQYERMGEYIPRPDLSGLVHHGDLQDYDFSYCDLTGADLQDARLMGVDFTFANLTDANLSRANLRLATMHGATLHGADLSYSVLDGVSLANAGVQDTVFRGSRVWGVSAWSLRGQPADETDLILTEPYKPVVRCDDLRVAQLVHTLLENPEIFTYVETIRSRAVLLLGNFSADRKPVLDAVRDELRALGCIPLLFDFAKPDGLGYGATVSVLAGMSSAVIVDLTNALEVRSELMRLVPMNPDVLFQPILCHGHDRYTTFDSDIGVYPWVREIVEYKTTRSLVLQLRSGALLQLK